MVWVPDGEKIEDIFVSTEYTNVADTDRHTLHDMT